MRKTLSFVLIILLLLGTAGCGSEKSPDISDTFSSENPTPNSEKKSQSETSSVPTETDSAETDVTEATENKETDSNHTISTTEKPTATTPTSEETYHDTSSGTDSEPAKPQKPAENIPPATEPQEPETPTPTEPPVINAAASDTDEIAEAVVTYINAYRTEQGISAATRLSGLTGYAKYRSRQIISDFSHNTLDEREAATALSYGMYVDPSLYGMDGEPYYTACSGEAIAKAGYVGTVDYVAKSLAALIRNSSEHWSYVGSGDYRYIGVGITYESGMWYCDVALTRENYG